MPLWFSSVGFSEDNKIETCHLGRWSSSLTFSTRFYVSKGGSTNGAIIKSTVFSNPPRQQKALINCWGYLLWNKFTAFAVELQIFRHDIDWNQQRMIVLQNCIHGGKVKRWSQSRQATPQLQQIPMRKTNLGKSFLTSSELTSI